MSFAPSMRCGGVRATAPAAPRRAAASPALLPQLRSSSAARLAAPAERGVARMRVATRAAEEAAEAEAAAPEEPAADTGRSLTTRGAAGKKSPFGPPGAGGRRPPKEKPEFEERVVQVSRVTKVVKGGKQLAFRAVIVIGNKAGRVGVGVAKAKEVIVAVQKAVTDAKKNLQDVPITATSSVPHKLTVLGCGSSQVMIRPALEGSGITAGGSVRAVLELAGYRNVNAKMLAGSNPLNNGRATLDALSQMRTPEMVARIRDLTTEEMEVRTRSARMAPSGL